MAQLGLSQTEVEQPVRAYKWGAAYALNREHSDLIVLKRLLLGDRVESLYAMLDESYAKYVAFCEQYEESGKQLPLMVQVSRSEGLDLDHLIMGAAEDEIVLYAHCCIKGLGVAENFDPSLQEALAVEAWCSNPSSSIWLQLHHQACQQELEMVTHINLACTCRTGPCCAAANRTNCLLPPTWSMRTTLVLGVRWMPHSRCDVETQDWRITVIPVRAQKCAA